MPNATVSVSWTPPPPEWLVYDNCSAAAPWLARYSSMYENGDLSWTGVPIELAVNYLRSMVPANWTRPTDADLLTWYEERTAGLESGGVTMTAMIEFPLSTCGEELCHRLQWQGDPDLAGVGVSLLRSRAICICLLTDPGLFFSPPKNIGHDIILHPRFLRDAVLSSPPDRYPQAGEEDAEEATQRPGFLHQRFPKISLRLSRVSMS